MRRHHFSCIYNHPQARFIFSWDLCQGNLWNHNVQKFSKELERYMATVTKEAEISNEHALFLKKEFTRKITTVWGHPSCRFSSLLLPVVPVILEDGHISVPVSRWSGSWNFERPRRGSLFLTRFSENEKGDENGSVEALTESIFSVWCRTPKEPTKSNRTRVWNYTTFTFTADKNMCWVHTVFSLMSAAF